ncbi:SagB/ThcOx family dehydrogenase [Candidatus Woesebacteria bacterium]|nr:SagB/ThcOx family dehydrogenase [Candidatus Woesebacteria bacterium]
MDQTSVNPTAASTTKTTPTSDCCGKGNCGECLKGGMPFRKELLSFALLLMIGVSTVLTVLYVQAKRDNFAAGPAVDSSQQAAVPSPTLYPTSAPRSYTNAIALPKPSLKGALSVEAALQERRTKRTYTSEPVKLADLSQMLWAGQGITVPGTEKRTAPSARESYPMTLFVAVKRVEGLQPGLYEYLPKTHSLGLMKAGDIDPALKEAGVQEGAQSAPVAVLISAAIGNYQVKTKSTTTSATYLEAGHIGQNMYLQAESIDLGIVVMAGFDSQKVGKALELGAGETVEYVVPMGYPAPEPVEE